MESQTLQPFAETVRCTKCGNSEEIPQQALAMPPVVFAAGKVPGAILTRYCPGGKEPEQAPEESTDPMMQIATMVSRAASVHNQVGAETLLKPRINICAGIGEEHLHRVCSNCGFEFLTKTKDAR